MTRCVSSRARGALVLVAALLGAGVGSCQHDFGFLRDSARNPADAAGASGLFGEGGAPMSSAGSDAGAFSGTAAHGGDGGASAGGKDAVAAGGQGAGAMAAGGGAAAGDAGAGGEPPSGAPPTFHALAVGNDFACFIFHGKVRCWGANDVGQLGAGFVDDAFPQGFVAVVEQTPTGDAPISDAQAVSAGDSYACALRQGSVWCWGNGPNGELGPGLTQSSRAVQVQGAPGNIRQISTGGDHACVRTASQFACWGGNDSAQISSSLVEPRLGVTQPANVANVVDLALDWWTSLVRRDDGSVLCWGQDNAQQCVGQVSGDCPLAPGDHCVLKPGVLAALAGSQYLAAGGEHACARDAAGKVRCWGLNNTGEAGSAPTADCFANDPGNCVVGPTEVPEAFGAEQLALGSSHTCALVQGRVLCWGASNILGRSLASEGFGPPAAVINGERAELGSITEIASFGTLTCAFDGGLVSCWGLAHGEYFSTAESVPAGQ